MFFYENLSWLANLLIALLNVVLNFNDWLNLNHMLKCEGNLQFTAIGLNLGLYKGLPVIITSHIQLYILK